MSDFVQEFDEFFNSSSMQSALSELKAPNSKISSLEVDLKELELFNHELALAVEDKPDSFNKAAEEALSKQKTFDGKPLKAKVRFFGVQNSTDVLVKDLGADHLNKLIEVQGVVNLVTDIKPRMQVSLWECIHCGTTMKTIPDKTVVNQPELCRCGRKDFKLLESSSDFVNMQYGQMQDLIERVLGSSTPAHVDLWFEDDLTNVVLPGENVVLTGILRLMPRKEYGKGKSPVYSKVLDVVHIKKSEKEFEEIKISPEEEEEILRLSKEPDLKQQFIKSIAPSIYGYDMLKEAIALQLFGGTPEKILPDGQKIRSDMHMLLIGDPGVAKSRILKFTEELAPKCIYVAGRGASGVGLTASAEKDKAGEGWVLKAGAMVLASGGLVAIDEFDKMDDNDRASIHEAMEQQSVSVAKAGIVTKFKTKTSVLAAANPKFGRFDPNTPVAQQFDIMPTLLSRFDLIFVLKDVLDSSRDRGMAEHILMGHKHSREKLAPADLTIAVAPEIPEEIVRKYIAYSRRNIFPLLSDAAIERIKDYYVELRRLGEKDNTFPITPRDLEGLVRLAEASAKLRLSNVVSLEDAETAIKLKDYVLKEVFMDKDTGKLDVDVVLLGQSKSKIDKIRQVNNLIKDLEKQFDLVPLEEVLKKGVEIGLDEGFVQTTIDQLLRQGELYKPKPGFIKSARPKW
ncbi:minichromosome maintenance protein MCM [Candidatus Micrarchaeota archaeon]|nr:minichromosome maintenance protein MCM [Candidatus Micrarchaeota archaeon]